MHYSTFKTSLGHENDFFLSHDKTAVILFNFEVLNECNFLVFVKLIRLFSHFENSVYNTKTKRVRGFISL